LHRAGELGALITDAWANPRAIGAGLAPARIRDRYHAQLADATILAPTRRSILFELINRRMGRAGWDLMIRRNDWFQDFVVRELAGIAGQNPGVKFKLFS